jgi:hypothetical protein
MDQVNDEIVIVIACHFIRGQVQLRDRRLSDILNDRQESSIYLSKTMLERIGQAKQQVASHQVAIVPKDRIVVAYEPAGKSTLNPHRLYARVKKQAQGVLVLANGLEIRGKLHSTERLDHVRLRELVATANGKFLPVTEATVNLCDADSEIIRQESILVNARYIDYIAPDDTVPGT